VERSFVVCAWGELLPHDNNYGMYRMYLLVVVFRGEENEREQFVPPIPYVRIVITLPN
jgi:hypothetical protein